MKKKTYRKMADNRMLRNMYSDIFPSCPDVGKVRINDMAREILEFKGAVIKPSIALVKQALVFLKSEPEYEVEKLKDFVSSKQFYGSWEWKKVRYKAIKRCGQRCLCCGWRPGDTKVGFLVVDHIKPKSKYPELCLEVTNLQVLCNDCNMGKSNIYEDDFRLSS